jgi:hypothetical protein
MTRSSSVSVTIWPSAAKSTCTARWHLRDTYQVVAAMSFLSLKGRVAM